MTDLSIDSHKLMYHPERVAQWKQTGDCYPVYVEMGLTNRCNHKCVFCALDWVEHGSHDIDTEIVKASLEDMAEHGVKSVMFAGEGEPMLHKDIGEIVEAAKKSGLDVSITTNGVLFNKEKADRMLKYLSWVRFSVDAGTRESYAQIHGTREKDFDRALTNLEYLAESKKEHNYPVNLGTQLLLISLNQDEVLDAARKLKQAGADNLQIKPYSHHPSSKNDYSFDIRKTGELKEGLAALSDDTFKVIFRDKSMERIANGINYPQCYGLSFFALTDAQGNVMPCNMFYNNPELSYGNLNQNSFSEIWEGPKRQEVLAKLKQTGVQDCRKGCRLDTINRYLDRVKHPEVHDNFI